MSDGNNFGLNGSYEYTEFEFDSLDCDQAANATALSSDWPKFFLGKPIDKVAAIKIISATVPRTFNTLNESFLFDFIEVNGAGGISTNVELTFPAGVYDASYFALTLASLLTTASTQSNIYTGSTVGGGFRIVSSYATTNGRFQLDFTGISTEAQTFCGVNPTLLTSSFVATNKPATLTSLGIGRFDNLTHLFLCSRQIGALVNLFLPGNGYIQPSMNGADGPQVAKIPINGEIFKNIHYQDPDPQKWFYMGNANLNGAIDFYFTEGIASSRTHVQFNGRGFSIKLGLLFTKDENTDSMRGLASNKRVASRTWPTSGVMYS